MARWGIRLFGSGRLSCGGIGNIAMPEIWWPVIGCLLAAPGRRASRSLLAAQIWPENSESSARHCLATAFWRIRSKLPVGRSPLSLTSDQVSLTVGPCHWIDVIAFERRASTCLASPQMLRDPRERRRLARALSLYRQDFLAECDQEWIALERERLRALHLDALHELALAETRAKDWSAARAAAQTLCRAEPLREDAQRLLIEVTAREGNRALALKHYRDFEHLLARELSIAPMAETTALAAEIAGSFSAPAPAPSHADYRGALLRTRDEIARTLGSIERALSE